MSVGTQSQISIVCAMVDEKTQSKSSLIQVF